MVDKFKREFVPICKLKSEYYRKIDACSNKYFSRIRLSQNFRAAEKKTIYRKKN